MSYPSIASLPPFVRADLPTEARQLYRTAYNTAWQRYLDYADRKPFCHRLARSEVKRNFAKDKDGIWRPRRATSGSIEACQGRLSIDT